MTIQWFPGHMSKARREIERKLKLIDVAFELLDARVPNSSRNPMIDVILGNKPRLILLNKSDLADPEVTRQWVAYFAKKGKVAIMLDALTGKGISEIVPACEELLQEKRDRQREKGIQPGSIRALIVGIPNVGKSTLINRLAGKNIAATGDRPGITKGQQWIKVGKTLELLDTPGILWPKFEDEHVGFRLAITGAIREEILNLEEVGVYALKHLMARYPERLRERYGLSPFSTGGDSLETVVSAMEEIGKKRGCLLSGGKVSYEKTASVILKDLRSGKLGPISLESPEESTIGD